jgi:hypothetical protein
MLKQTVSEQANLISGCHEQLQTFYRRYFCAELPPNCDLAETLSFVLSSMTKVQEHMEHRLLDADPSTHELIVFLRTQLTGRVAHCEEMTLTQLRAECMTYIESTESDLQAARTELAELRRSAAAFESRATDSVAIAQKELAAIVGVDSDVIGSSFDELMQNLSQLLAKGQQEAEATRAMRHFLGSFLSQLLYALHLPVIKMKDLTFAEMREVMKSIIDCPKIQQSLGAFQQQPSPRRSPPPAQISTKDADAQFVLKIHNYIAECCGHIESSSSVPFLHFPLDKLMATLSKLILEKMDYIKNLRGLLADILIRIRRGDRGKKELLMKRDLESLAADLFSSLDGRLSTSGADIQELMSLIPPSDRDSVDRSAFDCIKSQLQKTWTTRDLAEPFLALADSLLEDISPTRGGFVPMSPYFDHFINTLDAMKKFVTRLAKEPVHAFVSDIITKCVAIFSSCAFSLSSVSFAEAYSKDRERLADLISTRTELLARIDAMQLQIVQSDRLVSDLRAQFAAFVRASRAEQEGHRKQLAEFHEREMRTVVEYYAPAEL